MNASIANRVATRRRMTKHRRAGPRAGRVPARRVVSIYVYGLARQQRLEARHEAALARGGHGRARLDLRARLGGGGGGARARAPPPRPRAAPGGGGAAGWGGASRAGTGVSASRHVVRALAGGR